MFSEVFDPEGPKGPEGNDSEPSREAQMGGNKKWGEDHKEWEDKKWLENPHQKEWENTTNDLAAHNAALDKFRDQERNNPDWLPAHWNPEAEEKLALNMEQSFNMVA